MVMVRLATKSLTSSGVILDFTRWGSLEPARALLLSLVIYVQIIFSRFIALVRAYINLVSPMCHSVSFMYANS